MFAALVELEVKMFTLHFLFKSLLCDELTQLCVKAASVCSTQQNRKHVIKRNKTRFFNEKWEENTVFL